MNKVSFVSFYRSHNNNEIFNGKSEINRDDSLAPYIAMRALFRDHGYELSTEDLNDIKDSDTVIFLRLDLHLILKAVIYRKRMVYIQFEPSVVEPLHSPQNLYKISRLFDCVLTWNDSLVDNKKFFKFFYPVPTFSPYVGVNTFREKKLLVAIYSNKKAEYANELYSKRIEAIRFFEKLAGDQFDLYGVGWDQNEYSSYRGKVSAKVPVLRGYKYSICFENMCGVSGLISEKIFDCFYADCVPIFWGADNVESYIPCECFIDMRKFETFGDLSDYLVSITESEYQKIIQSIHQFLQSEQYKMFLPEKFAALVYSSISKSYAKAKYKKFLFFIVFMLRSRIKNVIVKKAQRVFIRLSRVHRRHLKS